MLFYSGKYPALCGRSARLGTAFPPTSYGDASQGLVIADFARPVLMFPDAIVDFFPVNAQMIGNFEAELDLPSLHTAKILTRILSPIWIRSPVQRSSICMRFPPVDETDDLVAAACPVRQKKSCFSACREKRQSCAGLCEPSGNGGVPPSGSGTPGLEFCASR